MKQLHDIEIIRRLPEQFGLIALGEGLPESKEGIAVCAAWLGCLDRLVAAQRETDLASMYMLITKMESLTAALLLAGAYTPAAIANLNRYAHSYFAEAASALLQGESSGVLRVVIEVERQHGEQSGAVH